MHAKLEQLEGAQEKVLHEVKEALPIFNNLSSIYLKPQQVMTALEEQVEKMTREKEEALLLERQHAHFIENYESHDFFTVEPLLEIWVEKWMSEFSFLQTGTSYIESLESNVLKEKMYGQPRWAQMVVVADGEEEKLKHLIEIQKDK